jgi:cbb3-type cytochrome oxidase maturation protein
MEAAPCWPAAKSFKKQLKSCILREKVIKIIRGFDTCYVREGGGKILLSNRLKIMSVIIILLIASISIAGLFLFAFLWGVKSGQFEDDYSPSSRILFEDKPSTQPKQ